MQLRTTVKNSVKKIIMSLVRPTITSNQSNQFNVTPFKLYVNKFGLGCGLYFEEFMQASQQKKKMSNFDVEKFRNPFESNVEWNMRRKFLLAHNEILDEDRLVCLSNCYVNCEIYGCTYPAQTMIQLKELIKDL